MATASKVILIRQLQNAYSGEKAAAYAYRGHALSTPNLEERNEILKIEQEEWEHRESIGSMLRTLGAQPRFSREVLMTAVGVVIYCLCRLGGFLNIFNFGWYMSMYGAGKLEQANINEYEVAALSAIASGEDRFVEALVHMAEVEWDHELYFRSKSATSKWAKWIKIWNPPPPRDATRRSLARENFVQQKAKNQ